MEKINELVKKAHNEGLEILELKDQLEVVLYQLKILNKDLDVYAEYNRLANMLIRKILIEDTEYKTTNKGYKKVVNINGSYAVLCEKCGGSSVNYQYKDNKCSCNRGWNYIKGLKIISEIEYKEKDIKKYFKQLTKQNKLSRYAQKQLLDMNLTDFIYITKVTAL